MEPSAEDKQNERNARIMADRARATSVLCSIKLPGLDGKRLDCEYLLNEDAPLNDAWVDWVMAEIGAALKKALKREGFPK